MLWTDIGRDNRFWDPWRELERLNRRFTEMASAISGGEFPVINIWTNGSGAILTTEVPGIDPASVDISVVGKTLTLGGSRKAEENGEGESYHRRERWSGRFSRTVELPFLIESNKVEARFSRGVLQISLPRAEADKPKKIPVKSL